MKEVTIIFPHQLFKNHPAVKQGRIIYLVEENLFYSQYSFHQKKLMLHRASMKAYEAFLLKDGYKVLYIEAKEKNADIRNLISSLIKEGVIKIHFAEVTDEC